MQNEQITKDNQKELQYILLDVRKLDRADLKARWYKKKEEQNFDYYSGVLISDGPPEVI